MTSIDLMMNEHKNILKMLAVMRKACESILEGKDICYEDFEQMIDFVRNYADAHHHGKEEKFLFKEMESHLGELGTKLIRGGMYVEHDLGRLYIKDLEEALERVRRGEYSSRLDVIAHTIGYANLLARHIAKEDEVVYLFGKRKLAPEVLEEVEHASLAFEDEASKQGIQSRYLQILDKLAVKYI